MKFINSTGIHLLVIMGFWVLLKFIFLDTYAGPKVLGDEVLYRLYAAKIFNLETYGICDVLVKICGVNIVDPLYPPLYPLFLASIQWITNSQEIYLLKFGNIIVSTAIVLPIYGITKIISSQKVAFLASFICGSLPFQYLFSSALMSENLYALTFLLSIFLALFNSEHKLTFAFLFGISLGLNLLTKHIFIISLPFIIILFLINSVKADGELIKRIINSIKYLLVIFFGFLVVEIPWVIYSYASEIPLQYIHGFQPGLDGSKVVSIKKLELFLTYLMLHIGAFNLTIMPLALPLTLWILLFNKKNNAEVNKINKYFYWVIFYTLSQLIIITYIMWVSSYTVMAINNIAEPDQNKLFLQIGERYFFICFILFIPLVIVISNFLFNTKLIHHPIKITFLLVLLLVIFILSNNLLFNQSYLKFPQWIISSWPMAPSIFYIASGINPLTIFALTSGIFLILYFVGKKIKTNIKLFIYSALIILVLTYEGIVSAKLAWKSEFLSALELEGAMLTNKIHKKIINNKEINFKPILTVYFDTNSRSYLSTKAGVELSNLMLTYWLSYWSGRIIHVINLDNNIYDINIDIFIDNNAFIK